MFPKNLAPKFIRTSRMPSRIRDIVYDVLDNPVVVKNTLPANEPLKQMSPFNKNKHVAEYGLVSDLNPYFDTYKQDKEMWAETPYYQRRDVFLKAADLIEHKYYDHMLAYTIAGQNKTVYEAEIDAVCELADFLRFNVFYADTIMNKQPISVPGTTNLSEYNPLNGFVASITPFNFTAIGGNLASAPLLFGNSVLWKPSDGAILSNYLFYQIMLEAGLPEGVLTFCPMNPYRFMPALNARKDLGAILFTGSSTVFDDIYGYRRTTASTYTRLIGETGGKNFHFVDKDCDIEYVVSQTIESAFDYSGQKCSACSVMYVPYAILDKVFTQFQSQLQLQHFKPENYGVINEDSYKRLSKLIDSLEVDPVCSVFFEPELEPEHASWFIKPRVFICNDHDHQVFNEEFFGPIVTIYPYLCSDLESTMDLCVNSNDYALTGSIFSDNDQVVQIANQKFREKTGNFYINYKSTGSVVGQQPFGGAGKSGTNDKAGDVNLLYRLFNQRNVKIRH